MTDVKFRDDVSVELVDWMGDEASIVRTARVSTLGTQSEARENEGLVKFLYREGHGTPFESNVATFRFEVPVFVSRQIVKHRLSSINEESGRYKELEPVFYVPSKDRRVSQTGKTGDYVFLRNDDLNDSARDAIEISSEDTWYAYEAMLEQGVAKEVARMVLPVNIYSTIYMTANLRSWLNFVQLRTPESGSHPQHEIALVGYEVAKQIQERVPTVWQAFVDSGYKAV